MGHFQVGDNKHTWEKLQIERKAKKRYDKVRDVKNNR
jgi:hypothetical protein